MTRVSSSQQLEDEEKSESSIARLRFTALIVSVALFMQNLDSTIIATALPAMARSFHAKPVYMSVALTSYLVSLSVFIPVSSWMVLRFGAKRVFCAAIIIFVLASVGCGLSLTLTMLVVARVIQGVGGAMMLPVGRLLLLKSVSRNQMVSAMSWLTMPALLGPVLGPPLGGLIVSIVSWRWIFDINFPIGIIGVIAVILFIKDVREDSKVVKLDLIGLVLSGFGMALLMASFETVGRSLVPFKWTLCAFVGAVVAWIIYAFHARRVELPMLDFSLLKIKTFSISIYSGSLFRIALGGLPFLLPLMLQLSFGYSPLQSGLVTFAAAAGAVATKPLVAPILARFSFRTVLIWNGVAAAIMISVYAVFRANWSPLMLDLVLFIGGMFRSLQFTAYNTIAYADMPRLRMPSATGFYATIQQLSMTLGIVLAAEFLETSSRIYHHVRPLQVDYANSNLLQLD